MKINKEIRRVRTPIEPIEELKGSQGDNMRTSGSYSIESLHNGNNKLMFSKGGHIYSKGHNTNHLKRQNPRYPAKSSKLSNQICTVEIAAESGRYTETLEPRGKGNSKFQNTQTQLTTPPLPTNGSCLSSPYLTKPDAYQENGYRVRNPNNL